LKSPASLEPAGFGEKRESRKRRRRRSYLLRIGLDLDNLPSRFFGDIFKIRKADLGLSIPTKHRIDRF